MKRRIHPSRLAGSVDIPGSKSHTIRALLIAAWSEGTSRLYSPLESSDTASCRSAVRALGAGVRVHEDHWEIDGTGGAIREPADALDVGNSGTTLYLSAGMCAASGAPVRFDGDDQIRRRSAANLLDALRDLCAQVRCHEREGYAPFTVHGPLRGGSTRIECPTSQYLSALLLACPLASPDRDESIIRVPLLYERPYVEMTLDWLDRQQIRYRRRGYEEFAVPTGQHYRPFEARIPGDFSSATFFAAAAAVTGSRIELRGLDMNDSQGDKEAFEILERMGCTVSRHEGSILVAGPEGGLLSGGEFDLNNIPDALPALAVAACFADGEVLLGNVPQARQKETDRIAVMSRELSKLGAVTEEREDGLLIRGGSFPRESFGAGATEVSGHGDHRVIMALAVAGLAAAGTVTIDDTGPAAVTFPEFFRLLTELGARIENLVDVP